MPDLTIWTTGILEEDEPLPRVNKRSKKGNYAPWFPDIFLLLG